LNFFYTRARDVKVKYNGNEIEAFGTYGYMTIKDIKRNI